jgi:hypothetical protein
MNGRFDSFERKMDGSFDTFERKVDARFESIERRLEMIQADTHNMDVRLIKLEK